MPTKLILVALATLLINLPMGYWRQGGCKFSWKWIVAVHAAVPLVILMRIKSQMGFDWWTYPPMVLCYFGGQFIGARWRRRAQRAAARSAQSTQAA